jgi:esterase/lipase superfamily enzyme
MSSLEQLQSLMSEDLRALHLMSRRKWFVWPMDRIVKEEHLGRCCYLAEEMLTTVDLSALKAAVGLNEEEWRRFKLRISR